MYIFRGAQKGIMMCIFQGSTERNHDVYIFRGAQKGIMMCIFSGEHRKEL